MTTLPELTPEEIAFLEHYYYELGRLGEDAEKPALKLFGGLAVQGATMEVMYNAFLESGHTPLVERRPKTPLEMPWKTLEDFRKRVETLRTLTERLLEERKARRGQT